MSDRRVVRSPIAPLLAEPRISSERISERLAGHVLDVLERRESWLLVRGDDGYEGWTHDGYLRAATPDESRAGATLRTSLGCMVRDPSGGRRHLPLGARLWHDETVESGTALEAAALAARFPRDADAIARSAVSLYPGTPYSWGGITPWGADCSGFVQTCFALHGVPLPRDAREQAEHGEMVEGGVEAARPADLLFFSERADGRITHVGIALVGRRMAHVALGRGGYAVDEMDSGDAYVATLRERFRAAKRILTR